MRRNKAVNIKKNKIFLKRKIPKNPIQAVAVAVVVMVQAVAVMLMIAVVVVIAME